MATLLPLIGLPEPLRINNHDRLEQENAELREALNVLVYKDSWGNYFTGLHGDSDVTEIVTKLLNK